MVALHEWDADDFLLEALHPAWHAEAACRGMSPSLFYPERPETVPAAKAVCRGCSVREQCSEQGYGENLGVWGGETRLERSYRRRLAVRS